MTNVLHMIKLHDGTCNVSVTVSTCFFLGVYVKFFWHTSNERWQSPNVSINVRDREKYIEVEVYIERYRYS